MKKRLLSLLLIVCMVFCLVPSMSATALSIYVDLNIAGEETLTLEVESGDSIWNVKERIEDNVDIPVGKQELSYGGKALRDDRTLGEYNIQKESTLTLSLKEPTKVATAQQLTDSMADESITYIELMGDISLSELTVSSRAVLLDLNGYRLHFEKASGTALTIKDYLTFMDSRPQAEHEDATLPKGGVITGNDDDRFVYVNEGALKLLGGTLKGKIYDFAGTIKGGTFNDAVYCYGGTIKDGTYNGPVALRFCCIYDESGGDIPYYAYILGGTFTETSEVVVEGGRIENGTFSGHVTVDGSNEGGRWDIGDINGGAFTQTSTIDLLYNKDATTGRIQGGEFAGTVNVTYGEINGSRSPVFLESSVVNVRAAVKAGTYYGTVNLYPNGNMIYSVIYGTLNELGGTYTGYKTVTFDTDGGAQVAAQQIVPGQKLVRPADPTNIDRGFMGWYNGTELYDFSQPVLNDLTLTAKWAKGIDGSGTPEDPYRIFTAEGLGTFRDVVNGQNGWAKNTAACAVLQNDIVLNDGTFDEDGNYTKGESLAAAKEWAPIASQDDKYLGTFDGNQKTIQGLYINCIDRGTYEYVGLFASMGTGAVIRNLTVSGYVRGAYTCGGIVAEMISATVENCKNLCTVIGYDSKGDNFLYIGGVVGSSNSARAPGAILNCSNEGKIWANNGWFNCVGGIASAARNQTRIKNCYNKGEILATSAERGCLKAGGIASAAESEVFGCYNIGTVTANYSNENTDSVTSSGGILADCSGTVSDCYNLGRITMLGNSGYSGGLVGWLRNGSLQRSYNVAPVQSETGVAAGLVGRTDVKFSVENIYYLSGIAPNGMGVDFNRNLTTDDFDRSALAFADGTILTKLIDGRSDSDHPWADECRYLAFTGTTLPVFKVQSGDAHTHIGGEWQSDGKNHWKVCTCNVVLEKAAHSGGTATCVKKAECAVCGAEYGDFGSHSFGTEWNMDSQKHWHRCLFCAEGRADEGTHEDRNQDHDCDTCGKTLSECADNNRDHKCDLCDKTLSECADNNSDHKCDLCDKTLSECADNNRDHKCDLCGKTLSECADNDSDHKCDLCDKTLSECADNDSDHKCDVCDKTLSECADNNSDHKCDLCGQQLSEHSGGTANCKEKPKCELCGEEYGEIDPNFHANLKHFEEKAATETAEGNIEYWYCADCGKYFSNSAATEEISEADTVTEKLPAEKKPQKNMPETSPKTGEAVNPPLWAALLFMGGSLFIGTGILWRAQKKKRAEN